MKTTLFTSAALLLALAVPPLAAARCSAQAKKPAALIELYTSEGCSSCPPADTWLAQLNKRYATSSVRLVPLALHVPYWDYIGWQDRFAQNIFETRQRQAAASQRSATIYTPQITINGQDTPGWRRQGVNDALKELATQPVLATLALDAVFGAGSVQATVRAAGPLGSRVILVRYENGLESQIKAGENEGRRLRHDFVARDWLLVGQIGATGLLQQARSLPARSDINAANSGLVLLLEDGRGKVLQALQLPAC